MWSKQGCGATVKAILGVRSQNPLDDGADVEAWNLGYVSTTIVFGAS